ncbi:DedA family protein, partial [Pyxidicoccus sp. 3LFB2]
GADVDAVAQRFLSARPPAWQVAGVLGGLLAGDIFLPVPSSLVSTAAGGLLGFWGGLATNWVGMMGACAVGYALGARAGTSALRSHGG